MAEDHRAGHDEVADPAVLVVVDVRAADADRLDLDHDLVRTGHRHRVVLDTQVTYAVQDGRAVLHTGSLPQRPDSGNSRRKVSLATFWWYACFMEAALPVNETDRLAALYSLNVLDSEPDKDFDDIVALAASVCSVP